MLLLVAFLAYNIFHVFLARNVKPAVRQGKAEIFWARLIAAELYREVAAPACRPEVFRTASSDTSARPHGFPSQCPTSCYSSSTTH